MSKYIMLFIIILIFALLGIWLYTNQVSGWFVADEVVA